MGGIAIFARIETYMKLRLVPLAVLLFLNQIPATAVFDLSNSPSKTLGDRKASEYCKNLLEADGLIIKFKQNKSSTRNLALKSNAKITIKSILKRNVEPEQIYENNISLVKTLQTKSPNSKDRIKLNKLSVLMNDKNLASIYTIKASSLGYKKDKLKKSIRPRAQLQGSKLVYACGTVMDREIEKLRKNPQVEYVEPNFKVKLLTVNDPFMSSSGSWGQAHDDLWGIKQIKADEAWSLSQGEGIKVAVVDSGVDYNHPDLWDNIWVNPALVSDRNLDGKINLDDMDINGNRIIENSEFIKNAIGKDFVTMDDSNVDSPVDENGHGTHVAGTIAAIANNGIGVAGVAPKAQIIPVQALSASGYGYNSWLAQAVIYASTVADIANHSWGGYGESSAIKEAFNIAHTAGLINIVAAGNDADDSKYYLPASYDNVITVAASTQTDKLAYFSNYGEDVDVAAPGGSDLKGFGTYNILSLGSKSHTLLQEEPGFEVPDSHTVSSTHTYARLAGTSMACPHVAGVAALALAQQPDLNFDGMRSVLAYSVDELNSTKQAGSGRINALKAASLTEVPPNANIKPFGDDDLTGTITIRGSAYASNFNYYAISIRKVGTPDWTEIHRSNSQVTSEGVLFSYDSSLLLDGEYEFRVQAANSNGLIASSKTRAKIKNINILSPLSGDSLRAGDMRHQIKAIVRLNNLSSVSLSYSKLGANSWSTTGIELNSSFRANSSNPVGYWDTSNLDPDEFYDFKFEIHKSNGQTDTLIKNGVYIDSLLKPGFPIKGNEYVYGNNVSPEIQVIDINKDGQKEILLRNIEYETASLFSNSGNLITRFNLTPYSGKVITEDIDSDGDLDLINMREEYLEVIDMNSGISRDYPIIDYDDDSITEISSPISLISIIITDLNRDGRKETYIALDAGDEIQILSFNIQTGDITRIYSEAIDYLDGFSDFALANLDSSQDFELVFGYNNKLTAIKSNGSLVSAKWPMLLDDTHTFITEQKLAVADFDKDGRDEIAFGIGRNSYYFGDGSMNSFYVVNSNAELLPGWPKDLNGEFSNYNFTGPSIANLDSDESPEISYSCSECEHKLYAWNYDGSEILSLDKTKPSIGFIEGEERFDEDVEYWGGQRSSQLADLNSDGQIDILRHEDLGTNPTNLLFDFSKTSAVNAWNADGSVLDINPNPSLTGLVHESSFLFGLRDYKLVQPAIITDLDSDSKTDIITVIGNSYDFSLDHGDTPLEESNYENFLASARSKHRYTIYAWSLDANSNKIEWGMHGHDIQNTCNYAYGTTISEIDLEPPVQRGSFSIRKKKLKNKSRVNILSWSSATDNVGVTGYRIYKNGKLIKTVSSNSFTDKKIQAGKKYRYSVIAIDAAGNQSTAITGR